MTPMPRSDPQTGRPAALGLVLMARVAKRVKDKRVLLLIRRYLQAGIMEGGLVSSRTEGTPQGGPLSPLLSNVLLDELNRRIRNRTYGGVGGRAAGEAPPPALPDRAGALAPQVRVCFPTRP